MPTLPATGREYLRLTVHAAPADVPIEVSVDDGDTWHPTDRDGDTVRVLVAGPDAEADGALPLPLGRSRIHVRATDTPEIVERFAGAVDVT